MNVNELRYTENREYFRNTTEGGSSVVMIEVCNDRIYEVNRYPTI